MNSAGHTRYWQNPELPRVEANQMLRSRHVFPRHVHDNFYAIGLMDEGGSDCLGDGGERSLIAPGEVCLINPGQVHAGGALPERLVSYRMIFIDLPLMTELVGDASEGRLQELEYGQVVVRDRTLWRVVHRLHEGVRRGEGTLCLEAALVEAVGHFLRYNSPPDRGMGRAGREHRAVRLAREILSEELGRKLSLAEVAAEVGLSRYHFLRVFKQQAGISPHAYRTVQRLEASRRLLKKGTPLAEAALETGFSDQSHFTNAFRNYYGATPGQLYRSYNSAR